MRQTIDVALMPDWLKERYYLDLEKATNQKQRQNVVDAISTQAEKSSSENKKEFKLLSYVDILST